jgi:hypothetical protein
MTDKQKLKKRMGIALTVAKWAFFIAGALAMLAFMQIVVLVLMIEGYL